MTVENDAADLLEELGLELYRVTDDTEALDKALNMAEQLQEQERGEPSGADPDGTVDVAHPETERVEQEPDELGELHVKLTEGDVVRDENPVASWARGKHFEVVEATNVRADEYVIEEDDLIGLTTTVAEKNPAYDDSEPVIIVTPVNGSDKEYAYPASRLTKVPEHLL